MDRLAVINRNLQNSIDLKVKILEDASLKENIVTIVEQMVKSYRADGKVLFCGNGGSSADAQHIAAELSGRYYFDRPPLNAEALHVNTSYLTAVANDYSFDMVYARYIQAVGQAGDVLVGLSTSGNSKNVVEALKEAKQRGMITIGMSGEGGGDMKEHSDILIQIPSTDTPRIQECHLLIGHAICELVEAELFTKKEEGENN